MVEKDLVEKANSDLRRLRDESRSERAVTHAHFLRLLDAVISITNLDGVTEDDDYIDPVEVAAVPVPVPAVPAVHVHDMSVFDGKCKTCGWDGTKPDTVGKTPLREPLLRSDGRFTRDPDGTVRDAQGNILTRDAAGVLRDRFGNAVTASQISDIGRV